MKRSLLPVPLLLFAACGTSSRPSDEGQLTDKLVGAAREGQIEEMAKLVHSGADPNGRTGVNNWTVLMHAIHKNQAGSVKALLDAGADPNLRHPDGPTPLMMAAAYGQTGIVKLMLERGADAHANFEGSTVLDSAISGTPDIDDWTLFRCQPETVRLVLLRAPDLATPALRGRNRLKLRWCPDVRQMVAAGARQASP